MNGGLPALLFALAVAATMLSLGMRLGALPKPTLTTRCAACKRLVRRGRTCPCTRVHGP